MPWLSMSAPPTRLARKIRFFFASLPAQTLPRSQRRAAPTLEKFDGQDRC